MKLSVAVIQALRRLTWCAPLLSCLWTPHAIGQTLNQQYSFYLDTACQQMGFVRDATAHLIPGQAGPNLDAFCGHPPGVGDVTGGVLSTASTGGGEGAELGAGATEDAALRRRRDRQRKNKNDTAQPDDNGNEFDLARSAAGSIFLSFDYQRQAQQLTLYQDSSNAHRETATLGADHRFGGVGLIGAALKYSGLLGEFSSGGDFQTRSTGMTVYSSWFPATHFFVDLSGGLDFNRVDTQRIVSHESVFTPNNPLIPPTIYFDILPAPAQSESHSRQTSADILSGYDFSLGRWTLGPRVALRFRDTALDAYLEQGNTPMTLAFDARTETSLRSAVGLQVSAAFSGKRWVTVSQLNADWTHEYREDQQLLTAHFAEDLRPDPVELQFLNQAPDRDAYEFRFSTMVIVPRGFSAFLSLTTTAGNNFSRQYGASLGGRVEF